MGIDFSKNETHFCVLPEQGLALERHCSYPNSQRGFVQAKAMLLAHAQQQAEAPQLAVAGEATSYYWLPMFLQLADDPQLAQYELKLYLLNARWVKWDKKSKSPNHKDDRVDARDIAEYVRLRRPQTPWQYDPKWLPVRFYTRLRFHLVKSLTREKNLLNLYLFLAYSTYTQQQPFSDHLGVTSSKLLADRQRMAQLSTLDVEQLAEQLLEISEDRLRDPHKSAKRLQQVLADRFPIDPPLLEAIQRGLELLLVTIQHLQQQLRQVETWIAEKTNSDYPQVAWLDSIPGLGLVLASGIAAEIGTLDRFSQVQIEDAHRHCLRLRKSGEVVDAVSKYAGLWWPKNASGQFEAEERHLSREGNAYLRYYVLEAADCMRRAIPSFAQYYAKKHNEANKHKHKRALILTASKALELCVTLLRRKECYQAKEGDH